jgi:hypothetical protein
VKRHRHEETDDGLGLFADVISGTLGIIMLTALFFALRAATSSSGIAGLPKDPAFRSELTTQRVIAARAHIVEVEARLAALRPPALANPESTTPAAADPDLPALAWISTQSAIIPPSEDPAVSTARLRDFLRQRQRLVDLRLLKTSADQLAEDYRDRLRNAREDYVRQTATPLRLPRETAVAATGSRWFYLLVRGGRVRPLYEVKNGTVQRDNERNSWISYDEGRRLRCFPRDASSWPEEHTQSLLHETARDVAAAGWQVVLLVHPDSFVLGRELVRTLDGLAVNFSWRPTLEEAHLTLALDGLRPPAPRK